MNKRDSLDASDEGNAANLLALLRERHTFPGPFTFKAIGTPDQDFATRAQSAIARVVQAEAVAPPSSRVSAQGNHQALTFVLQVPRAEDVLAIYAALRAVEGIKFVM